jgi:hypothetical protein
MEATVVLCEQPSSGATEAEWVPAEASTLVEHKAHHAKRPSTVGAIGEDF